MNHEGEEELDEIVTTTLAEAEDLATTNLRLWMSRFERGPAEEMGLARIGYWRLFEHGADSTTEKPVSKGISIVDPDQTGRHDRNNDPEP